MSYELIWEPRGVIKRFWGHVSNDDILGAVNGVCGDARFDGLLYVFNDFTDVESQSVDKGTIESYAAERIGALLSNPRIISPFVASSASGLAIVETVTSPSLGTEHSWRIFPTRAEARQWLGSQGL